MNNGILRIILEYSAHSNINSAVEAGNIQCLKYLRKHGATKECQDASVYDAASNGNIKCLKYLKKQGETFDEITCHPTGIHVREDI